MVEVSIQLFKTLSLKYRAKSVLCSLFSPKALASSFTFK